MPIDINITAKNAQPVVSNLITANFDADLHVFGTLAEHLDVDGSIHLNRTLIGIPNSLPPNVAVLDVRRRGKARSAPDKRLTINLDVKVHAPTQVLVQGRGLNAEMGGDLQISGTADSPRVSGGFELQRGSFSLASSNLSFTPPGSVTFSGEGLKNKIDPTLDFTAETSIPQGTATLHIGGYADAPQFELTSSPAQPQDEIMARLLFGESASQLSALQLAQIGYALASLSGVGGDSGLNPLAKVQKMLGLDRLTIGSAPATSATNTENTGASIEAGRYIFKRVYVEAKQNTTGTSQLGADIDITKRLKLQTRLGNGTASVQGTTPENDPGSSIGLSYQFEY
jgi:translocation and assembly module TamB